MSPGPSNIAKRTQMKPKTS